MKIPVVIPRDRMPTKFPIGSVVLFIWVGEKLQSPLYWTLFGIAVAIIAAATMLRQFAEVEMDLKDFINQKLEK